VSWENKKVLVTGGAGFIGSHLVRRLVSEGAHVQILFNRSESGWRIQDLLDRVKACEADVADITSLKKILSLCPQIIFHLAAQVDVSQSWNIVHSMIQNNIIGTVNLLVTLKDTGFERFIYTSSSEEYGDLMSPLAEHLRESPISPYSFSKLSGTVFCQMAAKTFDLPVTIVRLFPTYGPAQQGSMLIPSAIRDLLLKREFLMTAGEQRRDFIYVDDVIEAFLLIAKSSHTPGELFNVGSGNPCTVNEIVELIKRYIGDDVTVTRGAIACRKGEVKECYCDNSKIRQLTKWSPKTSLEKGLKTTVQWYKEYYSKNRI
jgi:nucleoside-diphosphate-sugar epimerase